MCAPDGIQGFDKITSEDISGQLEMLPIVWVLDLISETKR